MVLNVDLPTIEDQALGRVLLLEMIDTKRSVTSSQAFTYHDKEDPSDVKAKFGSTYNATSNGCVSITIDTPCLKRGGIELPWS